MQCDGVAGTEVSLDVFLDYIEANNIDTWQLHMYTLVFVQDATIRYFHKFQTTFEAVAFMNGLVILRICRNMQRDSDYRATEQRSRNND